MFFSKFIRKFADSLFFFVPLSRNLRSVDFFRTTLETFRTLKTFKT